MPAARDEDEAERRNGGTSGSHRGQRRRGGRPKKLPEPGVLELEELLSTYLNTRVKVDIQNRRGRLVVEFATLEDLERIYRAMVGDSGVCIVHTTVKAPFSFIHNLCMTLWIVTSVHLPEALITQPSPSGQSAWSAACAVPDPVPNWPWSPRSGGSGSGPGGERAE